MAAIYKGCPCLREVCRDWRAQLQADSLWGRCVKGGCDLQWKLQGLTWGLGGMSPSGTVGARTAGGRSVV